MNLSVISKQYPNLSAEEELELAKRFKLHNDLEAAQKLALHHIPLVVKVANNYRSYGLPFDDLVQEGFVGLLHAIKKFDPFKGARLMSFAIHTIKEKIVEYVQNNFRLVKIATTKAHKTLFWNRLIVNSGENILDKLGVTQAQLEDFENRYNSRESIIDDEVLQLASHSPTPEESLLEQDETKQVERLKQVVNRLDSRTRHIIQSRHLTDEPKTFGELGDELGISLQRVKQIEQKALEKIRKEMLNDATN